MATATEFTIKDAFKALEDVEDEITVTPRPKEGKPRILAEAKVNEEPTYDLRPEFDSRKSFYGKARVDTKDDGSQVLYSYNTPVVELSKDKKVKLLPQWNSSQTTLRHVKDFLRQNGLKSGAMKDIQKEYSEKLKDNRPYLKKAKGVSEADEKRDRLGIADRARKAGIRFMDVHDGVDGESLLFARKPEADAAAKALGGELTKNDGGDWELWFKDDKYVEPKRKDGDGVIRIGSAKVREASVDEGGKGSGDHRSGAQRYNDRMDRIFKSFDDRADAEAKWLKGQGLSDEEIKKLRDDTGLGKNALADKLRELGKWDEFNKSYKESLKGTNGTKKPLKEMVIDAILDRKEGAKYDPEEFYRYVRDEESVFYGKDQPISRALDSGTDDDVKGALCKYITDNGYSPDICDYVKSVSWLNEAFISKRKPAVTESETIDLADDKSVDKGQKLKKEKAKDGVTKVVDVDASTVAELKDSYIGNVILQCPVCRTLIYKKPDALKKSDGEDGSDGLYNVDEECPHCGSTGGFDLVGQVASADVETAPQASTTGAPESKPVGSSDGEKQSGGEAPDESSPDEGEAHALPKPSKVASVGEAFRTDGLDEVRFDRAVNQYLHAVYENVDSYRTTGCSLSDGSITTSGTIKYKSGKEKPTSFVLEGRCMTKDGKYKLSAVNETFSPKRAFTFVAEADSSNALGVDSMMYRYSAGSADKPIVVKGRVVLRDKAKGK